MEEERPLVVESYPAATNRRRINSRDRDEDREGIFDSGLPCIVCYILVAISVATVGPLLKRSAGTVLVWRNDTLIVGTSANVGVARNFSTLSHDADRGNETSLADNAIFNALSSATDSTSELENASPRPTVEIEPTSPPIVR